MSAFHVEMQLSMLTHAYGMLARLCAVASFVMARTTKPKLWFSVQAEYLGDFKVSQCPRADEVQLSEIAA